MDEQNLENLEIANQLVFDNENLIKILLNYFENNINLSHETILPSIKAIYEKQQEAQKVLKKFSYELYKELLVK